MTTPTNPDREALIRTLKMCDDGGGGNPSWGDMADAIIAAGFVRAQPGSAGTPSAPAEGITDAERTLLLAAMSPDHRRESLEREKQAERTEQAMVEWFNECQRLRASLARVEADRDEWKDATASANHRFQLAEKQRDEARATAERLRAALETIAQLLAKHIDPYAASAINIARSALAPEPPGTENT